VLADVVLSEIREAEREARFKRRSLGVDNVVALCDDR
jgi:hypothetical protein